MKAGLPRREPEILDWWDRIDAYGRIGEARKDAEPYVLHDGPPYANERIHLGHALNKILKDIVVKSRTMLGRDARYVPGWDCHGLPIEHRVEKALGARKAGMEPLELRARCRAHAEKFIDVQRAEFRRLGVLWDRRLDGEEEREGRATRKAIYRTLDHDYESEIVRQLGRFFTKGAVYHGRKPVHWCASCKTALAEAEVEYQDRTDPSIYVKFPLRGAEARVPELAGRAVSALIWTTTPWTLPGNLAIALHPRLPYVAVDRGGEAWIVAEGLLPAVAAALGWERPTILARFEGERLADGPAASAGAGTTPVIVERPYPTAGGPGAAEGVLVLGEHVTLDAGTGCVHTAPGHGADDFHVGQAYGLPPFNPVDDDGRFDPAQVGPAWLGGTPALDANARIIDDLKERGWLVHDEPYTHSYPHCWRCKTPILFRSTPQWFISLEADDLRGRSLAEIRACRWLPAFGEQRIAQMIETRPDWCISRQRAWGVPVPAVVCASCLPDDPTAFVRAAEFFEHLATLFEAEGSDAWFGKPGDDGRPVPYATPGERLARLVPEPVACPRCGSRDHLEFHEHIVDVWFESGVSHAATLGRDPRLPWPSDLYLEGHDQYRGWFHSSLLVAVNDRGRAPYREVVTHGFTLDARGHKMSKSAGNAVSPLDVADRRGAEILRMWVAMVDFFEDMRLSDEILDRNAEAYRKIRNTFRYLLGNLDGFDAEKDSLAYDELEEIDRWALQRLEALRRQLVAAYERHQYHTVYHGLHQFCGVTLSSFYLDVIKDRLYTQPPRRRRSAQTVLYRMAVDLARLMAPVLCFTAEEIWQELEALHGRERWGANTVHAEHFPKPLTLGEEARQLERWERLLGIRDEVSKALELARSEKSIRGSLEACVTIEAPEDTIAFLREFGDELRFVLITSGVELRAAGAAGAPGDGPPASGDDVLARLESERIPELRVLVTRARGDKCQRCWHYTDDVDQDPNWPGACGRCVAAIGEIRSEAAR